MNIFTASKNSTDTIAKTVATFLSNILLIGRPLKKKVSLNVFPKVPLKILYGNPITIENRNLEKVIETAVLNFCFSHVIFFLIITSTVPFVAIPVI